MESFNKESYRAGRRNAGALAICIAISSAGAGAAETASAVPGGSNATGASSAEGAEPAKGDESRNFHLGGYLRTWVSFNLQNHPETAAGDRWDPSMVRGALLLDGDLKTGPLSWKAVGRFDGEYKTTYLKRLEDKVRAATPGGPGSNMMDMYTQEQLRELYVDFAPTDRIKLRIGRQQVVWGETDFFQAMDIVQGYDFRWRFFLERESDELRKPLIMVNAKVDVPEADGNLQALLRPGVDRDFDIGNSYDLSGGRWALQPNKGIDLLAPGFLTNNYHYRDGDVKDPTGGLRWSGTAGPVSYSLAYLKTFNLDPVVNSAFVPFDERPKGALGDFVHPKVDLVGMTMNSYVPSIDSVLSTEITYTKNGNYNVGANFLNGALPGFGGIKKKNVLQTMFRTDKNVNLQRFLGTSRPSFFSVQVFDKWIQSFDRRDDLVELAGYGAPVKQHTTLVTMILGLNYRNDTINPSVAVGTDVSNNGGFVSPSVDFAWGDHWRLKLEGDFFFYGAQKQPGQVEQSTHLFGTLANNDQLLLRLTWQF